MKRQVMRTTFVLAALSAGVLAACGGAPASGAVIAGAPSATAPAAVISAAPTAAATASAAPTGTPLPTATATPTHPLMIEVMRAQEYPGSPLVIEQTLDPGVGYHRFVVSYQSEGNKIYALLTIPSGERPPTGWPVIIFNHGYIPPSQYRTTERYVAYVDTFARHGYIVLRSDYRGHGDSEGQPSGAYGSPGYTIDVLNAVASVKTLSDADPSRIGMWGHSMGGNITMRAMVISQDIKAGVIWGGVVGSYQDLFEHWWNRRDGDGPTPTPNPSSTRGSWRRGLFSTYGTPEENAAFWDSISPTSYLADISGPIQLHHARGDETVPYMLSEVFYAKLLAAGVPAELYLYDGDDHNIRQNFSTAMVYSVMFFDQYVKGEQ